MLSMLNEDQLQSLTTVPWVKENDSKANKKSEAQFLRLATRRRMAKNLAKADRFWKSCDEALASTSTKTIETVHDMFIPTDFGLLRKLGEGGYGCVYKAVHLETGHVVALKELSNGKTSSAIETRHHRTLPWDCGVVPCYGTFRAASAFKEDEEAGVVVEEEETKETAARRSKLTSWLILKHCQNGSLSDRLLGERGVLSEKEAYRLLKCLVKTLLYLKDHHGIVHNDIKPDNLLLADDEETYYLCDLGAARKGLWQKSRLGGTYSYMSPEKLLGRKLEGYLSYYCNNEKHDVFAIGVTLFAALFFKHPFHCKALAKCTTIASSKQDAAKLYDLLAKTNYDTLQYPDNCHSSNKLKDLLQGMLSHSSQDRLTLVHVQDHPWLHRRRGRKGRALFQSLWLCSRRHHPSNPATAQDDDDALEKARLWPDPTEATAEDDSNNADSISSADKGLLRASERMCSC